MVHEPGHWDRQQNRTAAPMMNTAVTMMAPSYRPVAESQNPPRYLYKDPQGIIQGISTLLSYPMVTN
jgi:hypothetical protein